MTQTTNRIASLFFSTLLLTSLSLSTALNTSCAMELETLTNNPNDIIINITNEIKLVTEEHTLQIDSITDRLSKTELRTTTLEKFMNNISRESPTIIKSIPVDNILEVAFVGAFIGTTIYYYNPTLASPFIFLYFFYSNYGSLKLVRDLGAVVSLPPIVNADKKTQ